MPIMMKKVKGLIFFFFVCGHVSLSVNNLKPF